MAQLSGPNQDAIQRWPRYVSRKTLRAARIVNGEAPADDRAGAVLVRLESGEQFKISVSPEWWTRHGPQVKPGSLLLCYERDGYLSVSPPAPFQESATLIAEPKVGPWMGR